MSHLPDTEGRPSFVRMTDLASRAIAGAVVYANDEFFAEKENLILPHEPSFDPDAFGHKGKIYDGWETRRRREKGVDCAIVRLGVPGVVAGVTIDTAWFKGNYPPGASVEGVWMEGYPTPEELLAAEWRPLLAEVPLQGDHKNDYAVAPSRPVTHVKLTMIPDGGIARLRVYGAPAPDPRFLRGTIDLAALENGGSIAECSNLFYSSPANILTPGRSTHMGEGWENARRRDDANDYVTVRLAGVGTLEHIELDTSYYIGNAPGEAALHGIRSEADLTRPENWGELVPRTRLLPDCRHRFLVEGDAAGEEFAYVRADVHPDGGIARLRLFGRMTDDALAAAQAAVDGTTTVEK